MKIRVSPKLQKSDRTIIAASDNQYDSYREHTTEDNAAECIHDWRGKNVEMMKKTFEESEVENLFCST